LWSLFEVSLFLGLLTPRWNFEKTEFYFLPDDGGLIKPTKIRGARYGEGGGRREMQSEFWWEKPEGQTNFEDLEIEAN
jgi:hypothetical protein